MRIFKKDNYMKTAAIVLAAGSGSRMHQKTKKQFMEISGKPLIWYSLNTFENSPLIDGIVLVTSKEDIDYCRNEIVNKYSFSKVKKIVAGGKERYHSVNNGLLALELENPIYVYVHDGARPFVNEDIIERAYIDVVKYSACVVGMPVKDTIKIADENGFAQTTPDRDRTWIVQTPQVFEYPLIKECYSKAIMEEKQLLEKGIHITDDAMCVEYFSETKVKLTQGAYTNIKVTTPDDIQSAESILSSI